MPAGITKRTDMDAGLQVVEGREEKYPARHVEDPLYTVTVNDEYLHVATLEERNNHSKAVDKPPTVETQSRKRLPYKNKRFVYLISAVLVLVIVGSCIGGIIGSRNKNNKDSRYNS